LAVFVELSCTWPDRPRRLHR